MGQRFTAPLSNLSASFKIRSKLFRLQFEQAAEWLANRLSIRKVAERVECNEKTIDPGSSTPSFARDPHQPAFIQTIREHWIFCRGHVRLPCLPLRTY